MWSTGINALTGIIPACEDHHDINNFSRIKKPIDHYATCGKGSPSKSKRSWAQIPKVGSLIGIHKIWVPSYSEVETENTIHDPDDYSIHIPAEIREDMNVYLNGVFIAESPKLKKNARGKDIQTTSAEKLRFCRGVIWWLMNDETCLKDKLSEIGYMSPVPVPVVVPAEDNLVEHITGSALPGPGLIPVPVDHDQEYYNDRMTILKDLIDEGTEDPECERDEITDHNINLQKVIVFDRMQTLKEAFPEDYPAPVTVIRSWSIPQLRITIQECVLA